MDALQQSARVARLRPRLEQELTEIETLDAENASWSVPVELDQQSDGRVIIQQAPKRIEQGEFGLYIECGELIATGGLNVDPVFTVCVKFAE